MGMSICFTAAQSPLFSPSCPILCERSARLRVMRLALSINRKKSAKGKEISLSEFDKELEIEISEYKRKFLGHYSETVASILRNRYVRVLKTYSLYDPWAKAVIVEDSRSRKVMYLVDEIPLTKDEYALYKKVLDMIYWTLEPPPPNVDPYTYFIDQAKKIIYQYRISLGRTPGISWAKILYYVAKETVGFGPIDPLMRDPYIEDISCDGVGKPVYVWHREFEYIPTNIVFKEEEDLDSFVVRLAHKAGKHVSIAFPIVDAILPGGHRLAATYKKEVSTGGSTFTIRKFREDPITIVDLVIWNTISIDLAAYMWMAIEDKMTGLILGVTGAGKTSMLNALATLLRPTVKVVTIEDTPELKLPLENWVQLVSRPSYGVGPEKIGEVTLFDLVKIALRYRPDVIIVGEIRGEEAYVLFQAMATGHGGMTTMHAENIDAAVKRLTSPPMNIPPSYIPLINFALVIKRVSIGGRVRRRVTDVWEVVDYNNYVEVAKWNPRTDAHELYIERSKQMREFGEVRGWDFERVLEEHKRRCCVLKWMAIRGLRHYKAVAEVVQRYYANPDETYRQCLEELRRYGVEI